MEEEDNQKGEGNALNTYYRLYDPRLGLWLGIDPVFHESLSPYNAMDGNPILYSDANGANSTETTKEYTVKDGETLTGIANANGTSVDAIMDVNKGKITHKDKIIAGQTIQIPVPSTTTANSSNSNKGKPLVFKTSGSYTPQSLNTAGATPQQTSIQSATPQSPSGWQQFGSNLSTGSPTTPDEHVLVGSYHLINDAYLLGQRAWNGVADAIERGKIRHGIGDNKEYDRMQRLKALDKTDQEEEEHLLTGKKATKDDINGAGVRTAFAVATGGAKTLNRTGFGRGGGTAATGEAVVGAPSKCFVGSTLVSMADGMQAITTITTGDSVWAYDEASGQTNLRKVIATSKHEYSGKLVHIVVGSDTIKSTVEHPFYINGRWVESQYVRVGEPLTLLNGSTAPVRAVWSVDTVVSVYNFTVEHSHTYYVSPLGVLVHNTCTVDVIRTLPDGSAVKVTLNVPEGFRPVRNQFSEGQKIFTNGKTYISPDVTTHNGGAWKQAKTIEKLGSKSTRMGTYNEQLERIGD